MEREEQWLIRCKKGDYGWFEELVDDYKNRIYAMAWRFTLNRADAEDLAQDIFLLLYRKLHTFRGNAALSTWIYRVAYNRAVRQKPSATPLPLMDTGIPAAAPTDFSLQMDVHDAIRQLPSIYRAVIELHYFQGLSAPEIAAVLQAPVRTIETRIYRAREKLRPLLLPDGKDASHG